MPANRPAALAHLKKYFAETDEATLKISFDALIPAIRKWASCGVRSRTSCRL